MSSQWFVHAIERFNDLANYWTATTINASLVADHAGPLNATPGWRTINDFLTGNGNPALINQQTIASTQAPSWKSDRWVWSFLNEINFGSVVNARQIAGVLLHEGANNVTSNNIIAVHDSAITGLGGDVTWGQAGFNDFMYVQPENLAGVLAFNGGLEQQNTLANAWADGAAGSVNFGFALCQGASTLNGTERTMTDVASKVTYCTNAGPNQAATPTLTLPTDTLAPAWEVIGTNRLEYILAAGGNQVEWLWANGLANETITGVLMYSYDSGGYTAGTAFPWHYDPTTSHAILTNQNIRYGDITQGQIQISQIRA